jgi:putative membrane protein insertion efficiency factor
MGHRHSPEEIRGARVVFGSDGGPNAVGRESVNGAPMATQRVHGFGVRAALFALRFYKAYLSMLFAGSCRFEPTCSQYAYEAVERFGVACGSWLAMKRLARCQPLSRKFGHDPVPENWEELSSEALGEAVCHSAAASHEVHT